MKPEIDYTLYLVTDRQLMTTATLEEAVEQAISGGCTLVQLREKDMEGRAFYDSACAVKAVCDRHGVPLIVNDRVDVALAVGAAGVHVGQSDLPAAAVRALIGPDKILGVSAANLEEAVRACAAGADYLGIGAMSPTGTKTDAEVTTMEELGRIRAAASIPLVVIGGVHAGNAALFRRAGVEGLAVVSAILAQPDIRAAARHLLTSFCEGA